MSSAGARASSFQTRCWPRGPVLCKARPASAASVPKAPGTNALERCFLASFEERNGKTVRQYSSAYTRAYDQLLRGMVERRMRQSILAVASFWYTAWVNAGQPDLNQLSHRDLNPEEISEFEKLQQAWNRGGAGEEGHD